AKGRPMHARRHAFRGFLRRQASAQGKTAADPLCDCSDVGADSRPLMRQKFAGTSDSGLDILYDEQQAMPVRKLTQAAKERWRSDANATFALDRLNKNSGSILPDNFLRCFQIAERHLIESFNLRAEPLQIFLLAARRDGCQRTTVECA